jgi:ATP-dependent Lon protease
MRRRVKEQQKQIGATEFRNIHFSYVLGEQGCGAVCGHARAAERERSGGRPAAPGQVWTISPGGMDKYTGLYRVAINEGPGSGVRILNRQPLPPFVESVVSFR